MCSQLLISVTGVNEGTLNPLKDQKIEKKNFDALLENFGHWKHTRAKYRVIQNDCRGFNNLSYTTHLRKRYTFFLI